jgi:predicted nucleic acid-binding protein
MIGLDTNVLLRLVEDSDPEQRMLADALVRAQGVRGCFVNPIVLAELAWTLARTYKQSRNEIADRLELIAWAPAKNAHARPLHARAPNSG